MIDCHIKDFGNVKIDPSLVAMVIPVIDSRAYGTGMNCQIMLKDGSVIECLNDAADIIRQTREMS